MVVAERDIPLAELRNKLLDSQHARLRQVMYAEEQVKPLAARHKVLLAKLKLQSMGEGTALPSEGDSFARTSKFQLEKAWTPWLIIQF